MRALAFQKMVCVRFRTRHCICIEFVCSLLFSENPESQVCVCCFVVFMFSSLVKIRRSFVLFFSQVGSVVIFTNIAFRLVQCYLPLYLTETLKLRKVSDLIIYYDVAVTRHFNGELWHRLRERQRQRHKLRLIG